MKILNYDSNLKETTRKLRKAGILHEVLLWRQLKSKRLNGLDFTRQKVIGKYIVDFYNASNKIVIEVDGCSHDNEKRQNKDADRDKYLKSLGLKIIRVSAKDVLQNLDGVILFLKESLKAENTPSEDKVFVHPFFTKRE
jgi:very-short-patch-repair endonuclease